MDLLETILVGSAVISTVSRQDKTREMEHAQEKKPGKNMLWGGRFTGSSISPILEYCGNFVFVSGESVADGMRVGGFRWDGSSYGGYNGSILYLLCCVR